MKRALSRSAVAAAEVAVPVATGVRARARAVGAAGDASRDGLKGTPPDYQKSDSWAVLSSGSSRKGWSPSCSVKRRKRSQISSTLLW